SVAAGASSTEGAPERSLPPLSSSSRRTSRETAARASGDRQDPGGTGSEAGGTRKAPAQDRRLSAADIPHIQLGRGAVGLPAGRTELLGEADVMLSRGGTAHAFATAAAATVDLGAGEVELHVEKRPPEARHAFEVTAGG